MGAEPAETSPTSSCPSCADRADRARYTLLLIEANRIADLEAMEFIHIAVLDAGGDFARDGIKRLAHHDLPF